VLFDQKQTTLIQYPAAKTAAFYTIPSSVTNIGAGAFSTCRALTNVVIPVNVKSIGSQVFSLCTGLTSITIPNTVGSPLGVGTFVGCTNLSSVTIGSGIKSIYDGAFGNCARLTSLVIPNGVTFIGNGAFLGCSSLAALYFEGNSPGGVGDVFIGGMTVVYYLPGTSGWGSTFHGRPTALWTLPFPLILPNNPSLGVRSNQFGFTVSWATNRSVVVEASTNLTNSTWSSVEAATLTNGSLYFSDPQWSNHPARFYRVRSP
jgi:hypothetical protein